MIAAIPLSEDRTGVSVSFGRAPFFMIYDTDSEKAEIKENPAACAQGGAGLKAAQFVVDSKADALITVRCGENAAEVFRAAGIKVYKANGNGAKWNIEELKNGKLEPLTHFHAGFHGKQ